MNFDQRSTFQKTNKTAKGHRLHAGPLAPCKPLTEEWDQFQEIRSAHQDEATGGHDRRAGGAFQRASLLSQKEANEGVAAKDRDRAHYRD